MGVNTGAKAAAAKPKVGGGLYYAPLATVLPTDASTALLPAFKALGPISEDGVQPTRDTSIEKVKEWDGSTLGQLLTDESRSFEIKLYGVHDSDVLTYLFGTDATIVPAGAGVGTKISVLDKGGKPGNAVLLLEMRYGNVKMRKVIPVADAVITGEEPYAGGALMAYTITVEALTDASGTRVYEYSELDDAA